MPTPEFEITIQTSHGEISWDSFEDNFLGKSKEALGEALVKLRMAERPLVLQLDSLLEDEDDTRRTN